MPGTTDRWADLEAFRATLPPHHRTEQFRFLAAGFDVVKARYLLHQTPREPLQVPALQIAHTYGLDQRSGTRTGSPDGAGWQQLHSALIAIDEDYAASDRIDLERPLIVATIRTPSPCTSADQTVGHLVIDGWHRIRRAVIVGRAFLPTSVLTEAETELVRLD